jgi:hypothetical protein
MLLHVLRADHASAFCWEHQELCTYLHAITSVCTYRELSVYMHVVASITDMSMSYAFLGFFRELSM